MKTIQIGMIGSGFAAQLHAEAFRRVYGFDVRIAALCSPAPDAGQFAAQYGIPDAHGSYARILADPAIDIVDIVTPPYLHADMVCQALNAGKHVICEKPLTGAFEPSLRRREMYAQVMEALDRIAQCEARSGRQLMYAENYVYAPSVQKTVEMLRATSAKILYMHGEESHRGSHAPHAAQWRMNGGGALIRQGCHPLSAILYLKEKEAAFRGERVTPAYVTADVGNTQSCLTEPEKRHLLARPLDVEDHADLLLSFSDGTKAHVSAGDMALGGVRNLIEVFTHCGVYRANIAPSDQMLAYHPDAGALHDVFFTEKIETKSGWQYVSLLEEYARGYVGEMQDFITCAAEGGKPESGLALARATAQLIYAGYWSAEEGIAVRLE